MHGQTTSFTNDRSTRTRIGLNHASHITAIIAAVTLAATTLASDLTYRNGDNHWLCYNTDDVQFQLLGSGATDLVVSRPSWLTLGLTGENVLGLVHSGGPSTIELGDPIGPVEAPWSYEPDPLIETGPIESSPDGWDVGNERFAGFAVTIDGQPHYGWIRARFYDFDGGFAIVVHDLAYHSQPNTPVLAGILPTQTIAVGAGQSLTVDGFEIAVLDGVSFSLGKHVAITVGDGGVVTPPGASLHGTSIAIDAGGVLEPLGGSLLRDTTIAVLPDGAIGDGLNVGSTASCLMGCVDVAGATLLVEGGAIGNNAALFRSTLHINGGVIGDDLEARLGSSIVLVDGAIGSGVGIGTALVLWCSDPSSIEVRGGSVGPDMTLLPGATMSLSGGSIGPGIRAFYNTTLALDVLDLTIDGRAVELIAGQFVTITQRGDALMHATLLDGSIQEFVLNDSWEVDGDYFASNMTLKARRNPYEPGPDINGDGVVDGADLGILLNGWGGDGVGDLNDDGVVDGADLGLLLNAWTR